MKTKLLLILVLISIKTIAQSPISTFYGLENVTFTSLVSASPIDQSPTGANAVWNFNQLSATGSAVYNYTTPSSTELTTFPNSTMITNITSIDGATKLYTKNISNTISIIGVINPDLTLNYSTNNALVGTFPLNYGFSNNDTTGGTYAAGVYSGTFSGSIQSSIDAYGILSLNDVGYGAFSGNVTRIKTIQNINLNYGIFPNVGTVVQTIYNYYEANAIDPIFRYSNTVINVPLLSLNQSVTTLSRLAGNLATYESDYAKNSYSIYPNPVQDILKIANESNATINSVAITDNNARVVLNATSFDNGIDVSALQKGIYFVKITTDKGTTNQKMIKN